jgi:RNA polymerase sigma factor FliA
MAEARTGGPGRDALALVGDASVRPQTAIGAAYRSEPDEPGLVAHYAPMVKRLALHLKGRLPQSVELDDLLQAGLIAILRLARQPRWVEIGEVMLRRSVVNAMIDEARHSAWAPARTIKLAKSVAGAMRAVRQRLGHDGSDADIAAELGLTLDRYDDVMVELAGVSLLGLDAFDDGENALQTAPEQEEGLRRQRLAAALAAAVGVLPSREKLVVSLYYEHDLSMEEVGEILGLDKSTVSRSHARALLMLRNALAEWDGPTGPPELRTGA